MTAHLITRIARSSCHIEEVQARPALQQGPLLLSVEEVAGFIQNGCAFTVVTDEPMVSTHVPIALGTCLKCGAMTITHEPGTPLGAGLDALKTYGFKVA